ncbi:tyramine beta-hydroxylase isoform X2 [Harmonia axyridis]|uniref:tyramine beta-hydroxylase isoform X2 n=1 Tax=Harmonia axyridis TaxID=115357 RepID=UPI001E279955|nr:tyramine beta-hydroxylase isoform X2 [Harmonia axyridis]
MFELLNSSVIIYFLVLHGALNAESKVFHAPLDSKSETMLHWVLDYPSKSIIFEVHLPRMDLQWFALGFSERGDLFPADYCVLTSGWNTVNFVDTWADNDGILHLDDEQNCNHFQQKNIKSVSKFTFSRKFDTCDDKDYIIEEGTTHIVWLRDEGPLTNVEGFNVSNHSKEKRGMIRVSLLKSLYESELPSFVKNFDIVVDKVKVPADETTYWCSVRKLPTKFKNKHHIYQFEANIQKSSEGIVHHMEVFHCLAPANDQIPLYEGSCFSVERPAGTQVCKRVLAAWAMGAGPFTYPEEASLPLGGPDFNQYIMLEIHYNNPELISGIIDSSGIRLYVSDVLKDMDAGIMELGLEYTDKMAIPPKLNQFPLFGYCVSECTAVGLPQTGITIFGSQLHTHLTGIKVATRHFRNGRELPPLNYDYHYSTHFQEIRRLKSPVTVLPGDALITRCDYNTEDRVNITLGGFSISDEMCVNYVHYFPASSLEVCKSSISDQALQTYFRYMNEWEGQTTSSSQGISDNYKAIEWNKMRIQLLLEVYAESPLSMQCNMSSGERFPGYWENTPLPPILTPLPPPQRECTNL